MLEYAVIGACVAFAAFCSGSEMGAYSVNRLRLRLRFEQGQAAAAALLHFIREPRLAISTTLIGTNVGLYLATVLCVDKLSHVLPRGRAELYSGLLMPPVLLILAEVVPKSLFQHHADVAMYYAVWPLRAMQVVFYPLAVALRWLGGLPQRLVGRDAAPARPTLTPDAFRFYLSEGAANGVLSPFQSTMTDNILRLKGLQLAAVMTPLDRVVMVAEEAARQELLDLLRAHRYSRLPVYRDSRSNIVGLIHILDVASETEGMRPVAELARGVMSLRQDDSVADALWTLRQARQQFAVVTGDEGRAVGVVTLKDLVEEIVGELEVW